MSDKKATRHNPHDRFFRASMDNIEIAKDFLQTHLPAEVLEKIDLSTLHLEKESFIDDNLRLSITDVLFKVSFSGRISFIYLLMENLSQPRKWMPLTKLKYNIAAMEEAVKKYKLDYLPVVYTLVYYNGKKHYGYARDIIALFSKEGRELAKQALYEPFKLINLKDISDEGLNSKRWVDLMLFVMKHIFDRDILPALKEILPTEIDHQKPLLSRKSLIIS